MTLQLIRRGNWGARSPKPGGAISPFTEKGIVTHWEGGGWKFPWNHSTCDDKMRDMQAYHMDVKKWSDIAYSFVVCPHGYTFEGRGLNKRSAANGDWTVNTLYYAMQFMWGSEAGVKVPAAMFSAGRDTIDYIRSYGGAGHVLLGHRNTNQTDCPGDEIYAWVKSGAPDPTSPIKDEIMQIQDVLNYVLPGAPTDPDGSSVTIREVLYRGNDGYYATLEGGRTDWRDDNQQREIDELKRQVAELTALVKK